MVIRRIAGIIRAAFYLLPSSGERSPLGPECHVHSFASFCLIIKLHRELGLKEEKEKEKEKEKERWGETSLTVTDQEEGDGGQTMKKPLNVRAGLEIKCDALPNGRA
ncbi:unnamed protein product [Arctogadus glacialis]